ncbi:Protein IQ-DOMAIN 1 [Ananas comosus]|uniref:Protein IQ-DOMAIN 1 n=1 Tax=Ananas comosus TaxID=4615 RepID=A0A199V0P7_ANACO|nr:Protein IQ-DOMAIN 1 [Ananas comosus]
MVHYHHNPSSYSSEEIKEVRLTSAENEQNKHVYSVALASAVAAEAAAVAAQAAAEVVRLTATTRVSAKSREEVAAIKIQTAFRGYKARRALRALRGLVRLKSLVDGNAVRRQTANALRSMQTLARLQSQIRSRRIRMSEENLALQRQLQLKRERELEKLKIGENWDDSLQSKEKIEANLLSKHEAAIRRERTLAYAFSHQWKNTSRTANPTFIDPNNPQWGWSWLERWMAVRPWESHTTPNKAPDNVAALAKEDNNKPFIDRTPSARHRPARPPSRQSPSTPPSTARKIKPMSPRSGRWAAEDDLRSMHSVQSERPRRHSLGGVFVSSVRDDDSLASSPAVPGYMQSTESARAKARFYSLLSDKTDTPEKGAVCSAKKRLSFPAMDKPGLTSPGKGARRHSGPPKLEIASITSNGENK